MSIDNPQEMRRNFAYLQELLRSTYSDVHDSYDVLGRYEGDIRFNLSLNYLNMSHQSYSDFKRVYYQIGLELHEVTNFIKDYENYKRHLSEVIIKKETTTKSESDASLLSSIFFTVMDAMVEKKSPLYLALNTFTDSKKTVDELLNDRLKTLNVN